MARAKPLKPSGVRHNSSNSRISQHWIYVALGVLVVIVLYLLFVHDRSTVPTTQSKSPATTTPAREDPAEVQKPQIDEDDQEPEQGWDRDRHTYNSVEELWQAKLGVDARKHLEDTPSEDELVNYEKFLQQGYDHWKNAEPSITGVMAGYDELSPIDIESSEMFLDSLAYNPGTVIDCASGIGRISNLLLLRKFQIVDMVDVNPAFIRKAQEDIHHPHMRNFYAAGLQDFVFKPNEYDVIWVQWGMMHLPDWHAVRFLKRAKKGLKPGGIIVMKDNIARQGFWYSDEDGSITRSDRGNRKLFKHAGLEIIKQGVQHGYPENLFPVYMYALQ